MLYIPRSNKQTQHIMSKIPDIKDTEQWTVQSSLGERWGKGTVELHLADAEARLFKGDRAEQKKTDF